MRLTTFSDYTVRLLIYLALAEGQRPQTGDIAASYGISKAHLEKVVQFLSAQGYVETVQGKNGGVRLIAKPSNINLGSLIRVCERDSALVECFKRKSSENRCRIKKACVLRGIFESAMEGFYSVLDRYTLADLLVAEPDIAPVLFHGRSKRGAGTVSTS